MTSENALLPAGLADGLPPEAQQEADAVERLIASFSARGYQRVKPPLMEFEEALLSGTGAALARETFRLMDPVSQRMLGLRADMTPQVARIAAARLSSAPRPLRLCYAGQVLRVRGSLLRPERQFGQVGVELMGSDAVAADVEVALLAAEALQALGLTGLAIDLSLPTLVGAVVQSLALPAAQQQALRTALDRKDAAAVAQAAGAHAPLFGALLRAAGPAPEGIALLSGLALPPSAQSEVARLATVADALTVAPWLSVTIDPVEYRGYEYQTGLSFTLFARGRRGELGRGGRYRAERQGEAPEPATGFSLYMDTILRALPAPAAERRLYLPCGTKPGEAARLRAEGWVTLASLTIAESVLEEAQRHGCSHLWQDGKVIEVQGKRG